MSMKSSPRPADDELDRLVGLGITRQQVEPGDDCLDPEVLAGYADGGLSAEERAAAEAHLAGCRDCRRALALQVDSDPLVASTGLVDGKTAAYDSVEVVSPVARSGATGSAASGPGARAFPARGTRGERGEARGPAGRPGIVKLASTWLPLAAALVVATGLWFAFNRASREAPEYTSVPAQISARNEPSPEQTEAHLKAAPPSAPNAPAPAAASASSASADPAAAASAAPRELLQESPAPGAAAPSEKPLPPRADAAAGQVPPPLARGAFREGATAAARSNATAETDRRLTPAAPAPTPPPPPSNAALADAAPARVGGAAGQEVQQQGKVAGQLAQAAPSPAAPQAAAPAPAQAAAANQNAASQQAGQQQSATQLNATQQAALNQQTGPMASMNVQSPPPAKTDERRQADASQRAANDTKRETANEKNAGGPSSVKSVDGFAKASAEEPKSVARAKAAPESPGAAAERPAAAPVDTAASAKNANAASGRNPEAESAASGAAAPRPSTEAEGRDTTFRTRIAGASGGAGAPSETASGGAAGARADDKSAGVINEALTVVTAAPAPAVSAVLRSADGARWWRIRAPSTIESSSDRGASWAVEYSDPSARLVRGAAAAKGGCWMIGASGLVLRTRPDGGWERVTQPTTRNLTALTATDHRVATVTDDQGRVYRTTDGGATWR